MYAERRPEAYRALNRDVAAVFFDDAFRHREAEPRAPQGRFGGEEGAEDRRQNMGRDAAAVILES